MKKNYLIPSIIIMDAEMDTNVIECSDDNSGTDTIDAKKRDESNLINYGFNSSSAEDDW